MKFQMNKKGILTLGLSVVAVASVPALAWAQTTEDSSVQSQENEMSLREEAKPLRDEMKQERAAKKQEASASREANKKAKCEAHKAHITEVMSRIDSRSQRVYDRLGRITELVKKYYEAKGLKVENYDALIADINVKKAQADTKLQVMLTLDSFSCDESNPRESIQEYRTAREAKITAMKAYRQSIRTLLVEVKQAAAAKEEM